MAFDRATAHDQDKVDQVVLALLHLTSWDEGRVVRASKTFDWDVMERLFLKGYIVNPFSKANSVVLTKLGQSLAAEFFRQHFGLDEGDG
jgi:hypothetical protein